MTTLIRRFALATLAASLLIHAATYFPALNRVLPVGPLMLMHVLVMAAFIATVVTINMKPIPASIRSDIPARRELNTRRTKAVLGSIPWTFKGFLFLAMLFGVANFLLSMGNLEGGGPHMENGRFFLSSHGDIIRELTESEFYQMRVYELRLFSGFWILFSLAAALLVTYAPAAIDRIYAEYQD